MICDLFNLAGIVHMDDRVGNDVQFNKKPIAHYNLY